MDRKQRVNKKQNFEIDSAASSRGQRKYIKMLASLGLHFRRHCKYLKLTFLVKNMFFFVKELLQTKYISINAESQAI
jgi:ribosomal protein L30/L7E